MSTIPRVPSAVVGAPANLRTLLAHRPELAEAFHRLYATMWTEGIVPQSLKETARMRNARVTDCGFCKNVRFDGALADGLDESQVEQIADGYESSTLSADQKLVLRFTDRFLVDAGRPDDALLADMRARFSPAEIVELTMALALFLGMSKVLVSLGVEPEEMDRTVLPTPALVGR